MLVDFLHALFEYRKVICEYTNEEPVDMYLYLGKPSNKKSDFYPFEVWSKGVGAKNQLKAKAESVAAPTPQTIIAAPWV